MGYKESSLHAESTLKFVYVGHSLLLEYNYTNIESYKKIKKEKKTFYEKEYVQYICLLNKGDLGLEESCSVCSSQ